MVGKGTVVRPDILSSIPICGRRKTSPYIILRPLHTPLYSCPCIHRHRQAGRQTERQTEWQTGRHTHIHPKNLVSYCTEFVETIYVALDILEISM